MTIFQTVIHTHGLWLMRNETADTLSHAYPQYQHP